MMSPSDPARVPSGRDLLAPPQAGRLPGNTALSVGLVLTALLGGLLGLAQLSQATVGVGFIAGACLLAIMARMAQARYQHVQLMHVLRERP